MEQFVSSWSNNLQQLRGRVKIQLSHEWPTCHNRMAQHQGPWVSLEYTVKTVRISNTWSNTEFYRLAVCRLQRHLVDTFCHRGFCVELRRCLGRNSNTWHRPRGAMLRYAAFSASCLKLHQMLVALAAANVLHLCCAQWKDSNPCVNGWLTMGWAAWQHDRTVRGSSGWLESLHEKVWTQGLQVSMVSGWWPFCGPDESNSASIFSRA